MRLNEPELARRLTLWAAANPRSDAAPLVLEAAEVLARRQPAATSDRDLAARLRESTRACRALDRSELLAEAADTIDRQNREVSVLISECQRQKDLLVNGATLTDEEREAVRFFSLVDGPGNVPVANIRAATLRGLLERLK